MVLLYEMESYFDYAESYTQAFDAGISLENEGWPYFLLGCGFNCFVVPMIISKSLWNYGICDIFRNIDNHVFIVTVLPYLMDDI